MEAMHEREEGEMSEDESMSIDEEHADLATLPQKIVNLSQDYDILYQTEKEEKVVTKHEKVDAVTIEERAKSFGIDLSGSNVITDKQIDELYENIGLAGKNERHVRLDTLHLHGITGLTSSDVFDYLKEYSPVAVERLSESSCTIVFKDHLSAVLAILVNSKDTYDENVKSIAKKISSHYWREGLPHPYSDLILMRFATNSDVVASSKPDKSSRRSAHKLLTESSTKNPWGDLCQSWGVYDHQEVYGPKLPPKSYIKTEYGIIRKKPRDFIDIDGQPRIISSNLARRLGKRNYKVELSEEESDSDDEWKQKSKVPRMRMHADDEEKKRKPHHSGQEINSEDEYPSLSIQIDNTNDDSCSNNKKTPLTQKFTNRLRKRGEDVKPDIRSRLGARVQVSEDSSENSEDSYRENNVVSRVEKAPTNNKKVLSSVWKRLDKTGNQNDSRSTLKTPTRPQPNQNDLRMKLKNNGKKSPLRIEIDNEYYESD